MAIRDTRLLRSIDGLSTRTAQLRLMVLGRFNPDSRWETQITDALRNLRAQMDEIERTLREQNSLDGNASQREPREPSTRDAVEISGAVDRNPGRHRLTLAARSQPRIGSLPGGVDVPRLASITAHGCHHGPHRRGRSSCGRRRILFHRALTARTCAYRAVWRWALTTTRPSRRPRDGCRLLLFLLYGPYGSSRPRKALLWSQLIFDGLTSGQDTAGRDADTDDEQESARVSETRQQPGPLCHDRF